MIELEIPVGEKTFTAIDFETAQGKRWSICQIGLVRVVEGIITAKLDLLVRPPDNYYWENFTAIHGISGKHYSKRTCV